MLQWLHFDAGILQVIFLYSFRGVDAMETVAMDLKLRSIGNVKSFLEKGILTSSCIYNFKLPSFNPIY